jgi:hypothetical protein
MNSPSNEGLYGRQETFKTRNED